jgi:ubiquitin C
MAALLIIRLMISRVFSQSFQVFVKTCTGKTITIDVEGSETIESVKEKINFKDGTPVERQRLNYAGKLLRNDLTVDDFDIKRECNIQMLSPVPLPKFVLPTVRKCVCTIAELIKAFIEQTAVKNEVKLSSIISQDQSTNKQVRLTYFETKSRFMH